jgi:ATP-dependent DNA ligase
MVVLASHLLRIVEARAARKISQKTHDRGWAATVQARMQARPGGIVSKRRDFPYRSGRTMFWLKIKNPESPAMMRLEDGT